MPQRMLPHILPRMLPQTPLILLLYFLPTPHFLPTPRLHAHGLGGDEGDDGGVTGLDELGVVLKLLA